jgi:hypothetical protein
MYKSRVYELFNSLPKQDIKALKKWVQSPAFNKRGHVIALFEYFVWCKYEKSILPDRKAAFAKLFPGRSFDDHKLRLSMSLLLKCMEQYLTWKELCADQASKQIALASAYRRLKLPRHFEKSIAKAQQIQASSPLKHAEYYQSEYALQLEQYRYLSTQSRMKGLNLQAVQENLDIAYMTSRLRQTCFAITHQLVYKQDYKYGFLPDILKHIESQDYLKIPAIAVYYYCYRALTQKEGHQDFEIFKTLIFQHQALFPKDEIRDLFLLAANYCIRLMNQGQKHYAKEGLSIYREGLDKHILLLNGILSRFTYRNIVAKAIVSQEFNWAEQFIHHYKNKLEEKYRESTYSFNLAWLEYERKNYGRALDLLNRSTFEDLLLNLSAKTIAMKIYYELEAYELLYSHLEAMKSFINRKQIISYHKKNYLNTIKFTKRLLDTVVADHSIRSKLRQEIEQSAAIAEKNWLLKQLPG